MTARGVRASRYGADRIGDRILFRKLLMSAAGAFPASRPATSKAALTLRRRAAKRHAHRNWRANRPILASWERGNSAKVPAAGVGLLFDQQFHPPILGAAHLRIV